MALLKPGPAEEAFSNIMTKINFLPPKLRPITMAEQSKA
jgi:hypothetical protein